MQKNHIPCELCAELNGCENFNLFKLVGWPYFTRILYQTEYIVLMPAFGSIIPNYHLIVPKKHVFSMRDLNKPEIIDVLFIIDLLEKKYGRGTFFEHGAINITNHAGACLNHVHLHFLPIDVDIIPLTENKYIELEDFHSISNIIGEYNFIRYKKQNFFTPVKNPPKQHLRRKIAEYFGVPNHWDWKKYPFVENMLVTRDYWIGGENK